MKRLLLLCVLAATLASVSSAAAAAGDAVNGAGALNAQFSFSVAAQSGPAGENPSGLVVFNDQTPGFEGVRQGDVSQGCLVVSGNRAIVVGLLPHSQWLFADGRVFRWLALWVQDNGPLGHSRHRSVDQATARYLQDSSKANACAGLFLPMDPLTGGDVTVIDG
jgi:hypothetical protein